MNQGKFVFSQIVSTISPYEFNKSVENYQGNYRSKDFKSWTHFLYMMFGQLTQREGIRDIVNCLTAHERKLYHMGIKKLISHSTLTRANESRDWCIWSDFAISLMKIACPLYLNENNFMIDIENTVYALDAFTIDLCLNLFP
jgi:hypothetical protein